MRKYILTIALGMIVLGCNAQEKILNTTDTSKTFNLAEVSEIAQFDNLNNFLAENLNYPKKALKKKIEGKVKVGFTVEKDGALTQIKIVKSSGNDELDEEALRVVRLMPHWKPGSYKGEKVRIAFVLPIIFTL